MKYALLILLAALFLFPLYWMATLSLQTRVQVLQVPPDIFPRTATLSNYATMLRDFPVARWAGNTAIVVAATTAASVTVSALAGYAFAMFRFPGKEAVFWVFMSALMVTRYALFVPTFVVLSKLHLVGLPAVILSCLFSPIGVYLFRSYLAASVPTSYAESARIDGAGELRILRDIMVPLCAPILGAMVVFKGIETMQDYIWQALVLNRPEWYTLIVGLVRAAYQTRMADGYLPNYGMEAAAGMMMLVPLVLIFAGTSKYFIKGIGEGGLKG